jgi:hypothetical protein
MQKFLMRNLWPATLCGIAVSPLHCFAQTASGVTNPQTSGSAAASATAVAEPEIRRAIPAPSSLKRTEPPKQRALASAPNASDSASSTTAALATAKNESGGEPETGPQTDQVPAADTTVASTSIPGNSNPQDPGHPASGQSSGINSNDVLKGNFFQRLIQFYKQDWAGTNPSTPLPAKRGLPAPLNSPPFPSADWIYGGAPTIGAPDSNTYPLMSALNLENSRTKVYGWVATSFNFSTSSGNNFLSHMTSSRIGSKSIKR